MKVLVTGFAPFGAVRVNSSQQLAAMLKRDASARLGKEGLALTCCLLPVVWTKAAVLLARAVAREKPDLTVHFGYSSRACGFQLESRAANGVCDQQDVEGLCAAGDKVICAAPRALFTYYDLQAMARQLHRCGVPATLSEDAGRYLCNFIYFHALDQARKAGRAGTALFVHMPDIGPRGTQTGRREKGEGAAALEPQQALAGAMEIIRACAAARTHRSQAGVLCKRTKG